MKKDQYIFPKSSFLGIAKDTSLITKILILYSPVSAQFNPALWLRCVIFQPRSPHLAR